MVADRLDLEDLRRSLAGIVGDLRVSMRATDRSTYSRDMWPRALLAVRSGALAEHPPDAVVWPETVDEIVEIVRFARRARVPIVPYGAGSGVAGGAVPVHGGIVLDTKRMDRVLAVDADDLYVEAECGVLGERLERDLARRGLTLGHFPSSIYCSTLGGWLATRSAGQMSSLYGKIEDMVIGVTAVTGRGDVIVTGRHGGAGAGPDWTQLLVGSEGTLAVMTSARLRLRPAPEARHLRAFEFGRVAAGLEGIRRVMQRGLRPAVVRLYDEFDSALFLHASSHGRADEGRPRPPRPGSGALPSLDDPGDDDGDTGLLGRVRGLLPSAGVGRRLRREAFLGVLDRPRAVNALVEAAARRLGRHGCLLVVGVEGGRVRAGIEAGLVMGELARAGGRDLGEEPARRWYETRYAVSYGMPKVFEQGAFVDTMEVAATWERMLDLHAAVREAIGRHAFVMAHFSHAYSEGCSIYFTFAGHAPSRHAAEAKYDAIWRDGLAAANRAGGTISHHHGVGVLKAPYMADEHRDSLAVYQALKRTFDPDGVLNPGKMGLPEPETTPWATITHS